ncbi:cell surface hyaluronidase-like [Gigantopelta aegis]|uniref:cell surface hyaluronidase-like n=1 Tax=Gigantopelta aegis TaxID=1735272 RepID=UPI001B88A694|nr:cell surface hyaluronidase-like [Gigantopelta aegis]
MKKGLAIPFLAYVAVINALYVRAECPHLESGLEKWSSASTWASKPVKGSQMTISKKILLDESPPSLGSITIAAGGVLVWADKDNITLTVSYILVQGRFQIGSETCKFSKKARIILTGKSDSSLKVDGFGRKFIGVKSGGKLEFHGEDKLSWTKLAQTIPAARQTCGIIYDHKNTPYDKEWATGIHAIAWNLDGSVYDFGPFVLGEPWDDEAEKHLVTFLNGVPKNTVVALAVHENLGVGVKPQRDWELLFKTVETLGGIDSGKSLLRNVKDKEAYAFIAVKGQKEYTSEQHVPRTPGKKYTKTNDVHVTLWDLKLKFWVESAVKFEGDWSIPNDVDFRVLSTEVAYPKIEVIDDVSTWKPGDKLVFTSTDFEWRQAEVFTVMSCPECTASNQFKVDGMFANSHFGEVFDNVDERGEVALLTRQIVIEGDMEERCYSNSPAEADACDKFAEDVFGGHLKMTRGFAAAHIEGVEFYKMGQAAVIGSYPVHFHMCDDVSGAWVRNNSIHHSSSRCVTIHGTDKLEVSDNVCYKHKGHGYFLEDSTEQWNILDGNIGVATEYGIQLPSDMKEEWCDQGLKKFCDAVSTFWISHPNNYVRNNVAAGSSQVGFWFVYADRPLGLSAARQLERGLVKEYSTRHTPIAEFNNNVAHSNVLRGLVVDGRISSGESEDGVFVPENGVFGSNGYDPRIPNNKDGNQTIVYLDRFTGYKNRENNVWVRGGNLVLRHSSLADSSRGITMAKSGEDTFTEVQKTVFVGESDNKGMPQLWVDWDFPTDPKPQHQFDRSLMTEDPNSPIQGFVFYDGPTYVTDCHFKRYRHWHWNNNLEKEFSGVRAFRSGGAISWRRADDVFFDPQSAVRGATFAFCDDTEGNKVYDGNATVRGFEGDRDSKLQAIFQDEDGSVTGHPGAYVVKNLPFFTTPKCSFVENWQMSMCPHSFAKVSFIGVDFVKGKYPIYFIRDDAHESAFSMEGSANNQDVDPDVEFVSTNSQINAISHAFNLAVKSVSKTGINIPRSSSKRKGSPNLSQEINPEDSDNESDIHPEVVVKNRFQVLGSDKKPEPIRAIRANKKAKFLTSRVSSKPGLR